MTDIDPYKEFLTQRDLIARGWETKRINKILGSYDYTAEYCGERGSYYTAYLYDVERVLAQEIARGFNFGDLVNKRHGLVFQEELVSLGWSDGMFKTFLPSPTLVRNWNGGNSQATLKGWEREAIAEILSSPEVQKKCAANLKRRATLEATKEERAQRRAEKREEERKRLQAEREEERRRLQAEKASLKSQKQLQKQQKSTTKHEVFLDAILHCNKKYFFKVIDGALADGGSSCRLMLVCSQSYFEELYAIADLIGLPSNAYSKKKKDHWQFKNEDARQLFMEEILTVLYNHYFPDRLEQEEVKQLVGVGSV